MWRTRNDLNVNDIFWIKDKAWIAYNEDLKEIHFGILSDIVMTVSASDSNLIISEHLYTSGEPIETGDMGTIIMGSNNGETTFISTDADGAMDVNIKDAIYSYEVDNTEYTKGVMMMAETEDSKTQYLQLDSNNNLKCSIEGITLDEDFMLDGEIIDDASNKGLLMMAEGLNSNGEIAAKRLQLDSDGNLLCNFELGVIENETINNDTRGLMLMGSSLNSVSGLNETKFVTIDDNGQLKVTMADVQQTDKIDTTRKGFLMLGRNGEEASGNEFVSLNVDSTGILQCNVQDLNVTFDTVEETNNRVVDGKGLVVLGQVENDTTFASLSIDSNGKLNTNTNTILSNLEETDTNNAQSKGIIMLGNESNTTSYRSIKTDSTGVIFTDPKGSYVAGDNVTTTSNGGVLMYGVKEDNTVTPINISNTGLLGCEVSGTINTTNDTSYLEGDEPANGLLMMGEYNDAVYNVQLDNDSNLYVRLADTTQAGVSTANTKGIVIMANDANDDAAYFSLDNNNNLNTAVNDASYIYMEDETIGVTNKSVLVCGIDSNSDTKHMTTDNLGIVNTNIKYFAPKNFHMFETTFEILNLEGNVNLLDKVNTNTIETIIWPESDTAFDFNFCYVKEITLLCEINSSVLDWSKIGTSSVVLGTTPVLTIAFEKAKSESVNYKTSINSNAQLVSYFNKNQQISSFGSTTSTTIIGTRSFPYVCLEPGTNGFSVELKYDFSSNGFTNIVMMITVSYDSVS